jgi:hypothetical protein
MSSLALVEVRIIKCEEDGIEDLLRNLCIISILLQSEEQGESPGNEETPGVALGTSSTRIPSHTIEGHEGGHIMLCRCSECFRLIE